MVVGVDPVKASTLLSLEQRSAGHALLGSAVPEARRPGPWVRGLDTRFRGLWRGGMVIGIGATDAEEEMMRQEKTSLSLHVVAAALSSRPGVSLAPRESAASENSHPVAPTNVYMIAPHTYQSVPILHVLLARTLGDLSAATQVLQDVKLLQYFDLAGLVEAVAEVNEAIYRQSQQPRDPNAAGEVENLVLIQGIGPTMSATHRRSGFVQANALLAGLTRNVVQLSRTFGGVMVLVDVPVAVDTTVSGGQPSGLSTSTVGTELESAFSGPAGEALRLALGNESLSQILEAALDRMVAVHDGLGRLRTKPLHQQERVVEVVKDRLGDLTGLWATWTSDRLQ